MSKNDNTLYVEVWVQSAGLGHVTRQLNLVKTLQQHAPPQGFEFHFLCDTNPPIEKQITASGMTATILPPALDDAYETVRQRWQSRPPALFVLDTVDYDQHAKICELLRDERVLTCVITDDPLNRPIPSDVAVNAHTALTGAAPPMRDNTQYLLGKDYFILAPEFAEYHVREHAIRERCENGFAFFGGLDGNDFTLNFLHALDATSPIRWTCLIGPLYEKRAEAIAVATDNELPVEFFDSLASVAEVLYRADIAVIAAGNTLVEAAAVGAPCIALSQNEIQDENAKFFARTAMLPALGQRHQFSPSQLGKAITALAEQPEARRALSAQFKAQIDGLGGARVARVLLEKLGEPK